jgi:hypothetical protein
MPGDFTGGNAHGGKAAANETTQEEQPMPDMTGGSTHGGGATTNEAEETAAVNEGTTAPTNG